MAGWAAGRREREREKIELDTVKIDSRANVLEYLIREHLMADTEQEIASKKSRIYSLPVSVHV